MHTAGNETRDMRHVDHKIGTHLMGDVGKCLEVDDARISRRAGNDKIRLDLLGNGANLIHVDAFGLGIQAVGVGVIEATRERELGAMRKMTARRKRHAQNGGTRVKQRKIGCRVGADARMRLDVGVCRIEHLASAVARDSLDGINIGTTTVIALAGIAFGILVGKDRAHRFDDRQRGDVLGCDQLERVALARQLVIDGGGNLGVCLGK